MAYLSQTDALAYSSIINNYNTPQALDYYDSRLQPRGMTPIRSGSSQAAAYLDQTVSQTSIKRACCLKNTDPNNPNNYLVQVRIPIPANYTNVTTTTASQLQNKYKYTDKVVSVPKSLCNTMSDTDCDNFYTVYCNNIVEGYKKLINGIEFDYAEFSNFKPECSCYAPIPDIIASSGASNAAPKCYMPGCIRNSGVWLDPVSRGGNADCSLTICNANIDISKLQAGNNISIANTIQQNCSSNTGTYTPGQPVPTGTTPTTTTPTTTTTSPSTTTTPITTTKLIISSVSSCLCLLLLLIIFMLTK